MKKKSYPAFEWSRTILFLMTIFVLFPMNTVAQGLDDYKWKNRLIILIDSTSESVAMQQQLELFKSVKDDMADRDLLLFLASETIVINASKSEASISIAELRKKAQITSDFKGVVLLGKDGGCKLKKEFLIKPKEIFDLIDGMPMRQLEMKNKR